MKERNYRKGGRRNWAIWFEDTTEFACWPDWMQDLPGADEVKLITANLVDPGKQTYCCSFTPSFYARELCSFLVAPAEFWQALQALDDYESRMDELDEYCWSSGWHGYYPADDSRLVDSGVQFLSTGYDPEIGNMNEAQECLQEYQHTDCGLEDLYHASH